MFRRLLAFAGRFTRDPQELVSEAIHRANDGRRQWPLQGADVYKFLCGAIRSIAHAERKHEVLTEQVIDDLRALATHAETPEEILVRKEMFDKIVGIADHDPKIHAFQAAVLDGASSRKEIANDMETDANNISVVRPDATTTSGG
jgi:hypothetical protein